MRLLVANRGEIAVRIFRACREMGIETVAVFSDADRSSPHVAMADYAVRLGPAPSQESYLAVPKILEAAKKTGATLLHPGYGFLAEDAEFARACTEAGLIFVGPSAQAMEEMGMKTSSRRLMRQAGVPVVPGTEEPARGPRELAEFGRRYGFPIFVKAAAGGGGKGMRRVNAEPELPSAFERATAEAEMYFGNPAVYAEKLLDRPRHVEVQIIGDRHGNRVAVGERECSLQRRHQKVLEECPSPVVDGKLRSSLQAAALAAAEAVGYDSCGTVEFLLAPDGSFYFLEMNTRLQVEHPVTEEVWGVDLAREMISIALGERLSLESQKLQPRGHSIECRIYAEDPARGFAPSPGKISSLRLPEGPGVRNDIGVEAGSVVPIEYDPMLGKLVVSGCNRDEAIGRLSRALAEYEVLGVATTLTLFRELVEDEGFQAARYHTQWLDDWLARKGKRPPLERREEAIFAAAYLALEETPQSSLRPSAGWRQVARAEAVDRRRH